MHAARDVDALIAAEWALEDLHLDAPGSAEAKPSPDPVAEAAARAESEFREREAALREEHEREREETYRRGVENGRRLGEEGEAARLRAALRAAETALEELREGEMRWAGAIEENVCALAIAVARQVIGRELETDQETVLQLVRRALAEFAVDQPLRIRVNPADLATMESVALEESETMRIARERDARWLADPRVAQGGCIVEGREKIVDGRVDSALERLYRRLTYTNA